MLDLSWSGAIAAEYQLRGSEPFTVNEEGDEGPTDSILVHMDYSDVCHLLVAGTWRQSHILPCLKPATSSQPPRLCCLSAIRRPRAGVQRAEPDLLGLASARAHRPLAGHGCDWGRGGRGIQPRRCCTSSRVGDPHDTPLRAP